MRVRSKPEVPRAAAGIAVALAVAAGGPALAAGGPCDRHGQDAAAIAAARDVVAAACSCATAASHGSYVKCSAMTLAAEVAAGRLRPVCRDDVQRFAVRSTCGKPGAVVCCITGPGGATRGVIRRGAEACRAPQGGAACVGAYPGVLDACDAAGCRSACGNGVIEAYLGEDCDPPDGGTCNASCRFANVCGNSVIEPYLGEDCDPPDGTTCDSSCRFIHTCGNGVIEPGEACDGQPGCSADCGIPLSACCAIGGLCIGTGSDHGGFGDYQFGKQCYLIGGQGSYTQCVASSPEPCPIPSISCSVGSCEDVPIDPLEVCCQHPDGTCTGATVDTNRELGEFGCGWFPPPETGPINRLMLGTCGADGRCVPAS